LDNRQIRFFGVIATIFVAASLIGPQQTSADRERLSQVSATKAESFYVSASTGDDSNPGTLAQPWRTINRAVNRSSGVPAGSVVYVAAGSYSEKVVVQRDGISLIGYKSTPGDQPPILADAPINPDNGDPVFPEFDPEDMPLLDGGDRASGIAISLQGRQKVTVRNFNIRNYAYGLIAGNDDRAFVEGHNINNVNVSTIGDTTADYSGIGIGLGSLSTSFSNGNRVRNALIINCCAEGFKINGDDNRARNIHVYSTEGETEEASTDYYVLVSGSRNRVRQSYIWRQPGSAHAGHGFTVKDNADQRVGGPLIGATDNVFKDDVAVYMGESFCVRHRGVRNNKFINCTAYGNYDGQSESCGDGNGIVLRDGASSNQFIGTRMINTCVAIAIGDSVEDEHDPTPEVSASNNRIIGAKVENSYIGMFYSDYDPIRETGNNVISDSTFKLTRFMFIALRPAQDMRYVNTTFGGTEGTDHPSGWFRNGDFEADIVRGQFTGCKFDHIDLPPDW